MKYCIGCTHLDYFRADPGYDTEYTAGIGAEDAAMACAKGHWRVDMVDSSDVPILEKRMKKAASCADYMERQL